jgi:hypothetical protein
MTTYDSYKGVPLDKLAIDVKWWEYCNGGCSMSLSNRLWEIHEETRWIPVSERMPTIEDADERGNVLWWSLIGEGGAVIWEYYRAHEYHGKIVRTHWRRIQAPEGA